MPVPGGTALPRLAAPARRALEAAGLTTLERIADAGEARVNALHGMGPNAMGTLREAIQRHALTFRP